MASEYPALTKFFLDAIDRFANPRAQMYRTSAGWQSISAQEMLRRVASLSKALAALGIVSGDRVGLFAPNCPEWHTADFAIQGLGAVNVPIYFNESHDRLVYILNDSGARVVFTAGAAQSKRIAECRSRIPTLEHVISASPDNNLDGDILRYETLIASTTDADVAEYRRRAAEITGDNLATIIYTSGTTGEPKGVMLTHANLSSNSIDSASNHHLLPSDVALEFLPLAHVYERTAAYSYICNGVAIAYLERIEDVPQALLEVHPTLACRRPEILRKDLRQYSRKRPPRIRYQAEYFRLGASSGRRIRSVARLWKKCIARSETTLASGRRTRLLENSRRAGRWHPKILRRRRAAGAGARGIFLVRRRHNSSGLRTHRDFARRHREYSGGEQNRHRRPPDSERAGENRRRRRNSREGPERHAGLLPASPKRRARSSLPMDGFAPAISAGSTKTAT